MVESIKETPEFIFKLNTDERILTVQKSDLKNILDIISKITNKTTLSALDIAEYELKIIK